MFFHHLKNFSPYSGHIYDDMRVSSVHKKSGHIGKKDSRFDLIDKLGYFPFRELIRDGKAYFISDIDLYDFLNMKESTSVNYTNESYGEWDIKQKKSLSFAFSMVTMRALVHLNLIWAYLIRHSYTNRKCSI